MNDKIKFKVLETMEWRNSSYEPGSIIEDNDNSYMQAMIHQGKLEKVED